MQQNSQTKTISSKRQDLPFSFGCPGHWQVKELPRADEVKVSLRGPKDPSESLFASITVRAWPSEGRTPGELTRQWVERRSAFSTFRLLTRTETSVAGMEAVRVDAGHDMPVPLGAIHPEMVHVLEQVIFATREGVAYQFTYRAIQTDFQKHLSAFEDLVASFSPERAQ